MSSHVGILAPFSRKRPLRRGDYIVSPDGGKRHKVLRARKVACEKCGGTGVRDWEVTRHGPYKTKVKHSYATIVQAGYTKLTGEKGGDDESIPEDTSSAGK